MDILPVPSESPALGDERRADLVGRRVRLMLEKQGSESGNMRRRETRASVSAKPSSGQTGLNAFGPRSSRRN